MGRKQTWSFSPLLYQQMRYICDVYKQPTNEVGRHDSWQCQFKFKSRASFQMKVRSDADLPLGSGRIPEQIENRSFERDSPTF